MRTPVTGIGTRAASTAACSQSCGFASRSTPGSRRTVGWARPPWAVVGFVWLAAVGPVFGQLTAEDIEALRKQGEAEGWTFTVAENPATRYALEDLCGLVMPEDWSVDAPSDPCTPRASLPEAFDWRDEPNCCPSVKDQDGCGSCWAFATVGPLECNIMIVDGVEVDLSEQWLVSCNQSGWGCNGGQWAHRYHMRDTNSTDWCGDSGAVLEDDFPYEALDLWCDCPYPHLFVIDGWASIDIDPLQSDPERNLKQAILDHGPITVGVYVTGAFQAYNDGVFNNCLDAPSGINHGVTLVGWDDNEGERGAWILRNSWGPWWGEDGHMRIEYGCNNIGADPVYIDYRGTPALNITLPDGPPRITAPDEAIPLTVLIEEVTDDYAAGTATVHYRYDGGAYSTEPLLAMGYGVFECVLPPPSCGDMVEFYISAEGERGDLIYGPPEGPDLPYMTGVGDLVPTFTDDFETDQGWTVTNGGGLTDGQWDRGIPVDCDRGDPPSDYDGSGQCYLTDNDADDCKSDVDNGYTRLISPAFDLSSEMAHIHFALWYTNDAGFNSNEDVFKVHISNDDGASWVLVKTFGPNCSSEWFEHAFWVSDFVTSTDQVRVRFLASDLLGDSIVEAGMDDFVISTFECIPPPTCDDGILNQEEERIDCGGPCGPCLCMLDDDCNDGLYCNGSEVCSEFGDCQPGTVACPEQMCDEETDSCVTLECQGNADCDDELYCNGEETCVGSFCHGGVPVDCGDGVRCTVDSCNEDTDSCDHVAQDALCDNGLYCDGAETCDGLLGCRSGDDPCPDQLCDEDNERCVECLDDGGCDDGLYCTGVETCDAAGVCEPGTPPCPEDHECVEDDDACVPIPGACCYGGMCFPDMLEGPCTTFGGWFLGLGTTCEKDSDNDGVFECADGCPLDPEKAAPGACGCGVPDDDSDTDGVPDCHDQCADTPGGTPVDRHGCPTGTGDYDLNGTVNLTDFGFWPYCMTGPDNGPYNDHCGAFDFDDNGTVDLFDFARFQRILDGP